MARPTAIVVLSLLLAAPGCAARRRAALVAEPIAVGRGWLAPLHRDHPLAGKIWDVGAARFVPEAELDAALLRADVVLLGETHDNPDHHVLEARLVRALTAAGRRPALAFEMLAKDQQPVVDAALARDPRSPDALARAVGWDRSGWPAFALYRPVFEAGLDAGLPIVGANLSRKLGHAVVREGAAALPDDVRTRIEREGPLAPAVAAVLRADMKESHCGELPDTLLDPMVLAQRARDAQMAARLAEVRGERGAVLVTGAGHARKDRGVPVHLARDAPAPAVLAIAFREVDPALREPADYAKDEGGTLPYDFVVFTPAAAREDPCEGLRRKPIRAPTPTPTPTPSPSPTSI
jgi:uncharacterized iron-regulated protein